MLVNATRLAGEIVAALPAELTPERTDGRDGFIHVYEVEGSRRARPYVRAIVRDFDDDKLAAHTALLRAHRRGGRRGRARARTLEVEVTPQYPNMRRFIERVPAGDGDAPRRRSAPRASSRSARRSAAAPTAHA